MKQTNVTSPTRERGGFSALIWMEASHSHTANLITHPTHTIVAP